MTLPTASVRERACSGAIARSMHCSSWDEIRDPVVSLPAEQTVTAEPRWSREPLSEAERRRRPRTAEPILYSRARPRPYLLSQCQRPNRVGFATFRQNGRWCRADQMRHQISTVRARRSEIPSLPDQGRSLARVRTEVLAPGAARQVPGRLRFPASHIARK